MLYASKTDECQSKERANTRLTCTAYTGCAHPLPVELRRHRLGQLVRVELAGLCKLHNPNRDKLRNGQCLGTGQPQSGTNLFKGFMHRFDLVRAKERRAAASAVNCFAQLGSSRGTRP